MVSEDEIIDKLKEIRDPSVSTENLFELGLVRLINIENGRVSVLVRAINQHCPSGFKIIEMVREKLLQMDGVDEVDVKLTFESI